MIVLPTRRPPPVTIACGSVNGRFLFPASMSVREFVQARTIMLVPAYKRKGAKRVIEITRRLEIPVNGSKVRARDVGMAVWATSHAAIGRAHWTTNAWPNAKSRASDSPRQADALERTKFGGRGQHQQGHGASIVPGGRFGAAPIA